jgi:DNA polymerase-4
MEMGDFGMHGLMRAADLPPVPDGRGEGSAGEGERRRYVLHLDMDAYFAAVEQRDHPVYRGVPLVVCHTSSDFCNHGVVATASYEARPYGIKAGMSVWEARARCPQARMVHADIPRYLYNTRRLVRLCESYSPACEVFSVDELFLDLTRRVGTGGWDSALELGREVKRRVREELGLTCSVGLGPNKLVAKMASEFDKPDGLTLIRPEQLPGILAPLPVRRLVGVGPRMARNLRGMGIELIGELAAVPPRVLERRFGMVGRLLHLAARGIDHSPVGGGKADDLVKSFGHSLSLRGGSDDLETLSNTLLGLAEAVTRRMRRQGYLGRTVCLRLRIGYGWGCTRSLTLDEHTRSPRVVFRAARCLLEREAACGGWAEKVTTVGLSVSQLRRDLEGRQLSLADWQDPREERLLDALDELRDRYGEEVITRASLLGTFAVSGMNLAV